MIEHLWQEHLLAVFPTGYAGEEIQGIDLSLLDADTAGCISTFVKRGKLDLWRTAILGLCYRDLAVVTANLSEEAYNYFFRLETLTGLVLRSVRDNNKSQ